LIARRPRTASAAAQSVGVRTGVSRSPDQFYVGLHDETEPLVEQVRFEPNVTLGVDVGDVWSLTRLWMTGAPEWQAAAPPPQIWTTGVDRDFLIAVLALISFSAATVWLCRQTLSARASRRWVSRESRSVWMTSSPQVCQCRQHALSQMTGRELHSLSTQPYLCSTVPFFC